MTNEMNYKPILLDSNDEANLYLIKLEGYKELPFVVCHGFDAETGDWYDGDYNRNLDFAVDVYKSKIDSFYEEKARENAEEVILDRLNSGELMPYSIKSTSHDWVYGVGTVTIGDRFWYYVAQEYCCGEWPEVHAFSCAFKSYSYTKELD